MEKKTDKIFSLKIYFGMKYPYFIEYLMKQNERIIKIFKLKFGEDIDIENPNVVLYEPDKRVIAYIKRDFLDEFYKKNITLGILVKEEEHKENIYLNQILKILSPFGKNLSSIFNVDDRLIDDLTGVFGKELLKNTNPHVLFDNINALINLVKKNVNRLFLDFPLNSQLKNMGYNNEEINKKAVSKLDNKMIKILYNKYGANLDSVHDIDKIEQEYLENSIIPILLTRLEKYYIENSRLNLIESFGYTEFLEFINYIKEKFPETIEEVNELFGKEEKYKFNLEHNLSVEETRKVLEISNKYNKLKEKRKFEDTERNGLLPLSARSTFSLPDNQTFSKTYKNISLGDTVALLIKYEDGTVVSKNYTLTDNIHILTKYEKLLVSTQIGKEVFKHSKGDTFKIENPSQTITITDVISSKKKITFIPTSEIIKADTEDKISRHVDELNSDISIRSLKQ